MNTDEIRTALADAYNRLGITGAEELEAYIRQALDYLERDRERYIEAVEPDFSEHRITERFGVICKLIPLAQEIDRNQKKLYLGKYHDFQPDGCRRYTPVCIYRILRMAA